MMTFFPNTSIDFASNHFARRVACWCLVITICSVGLSPVIARNSPTQPVQSELTPLQRAIEVQRRRLESSDPEERRDAVMRLGAMKHPDAARVAVRGLKDSQQIIRATAASAVLSLPSVEAASVLLPLLKDKREFVRQQVAYALGETRSSLAVDGLVTALERDKKANVRGAAAVALGIIGDERAAGSLARTLDPGFRGLEGINQKGSRKAEKDAFVQRAAARALGQIRNREAVPALIVAMADKRSSDDVKREAARALWLIGDIAALPALRNAVDARDPHLAQIAHDAIVNISRDNAGSPR